MGGVRSPGLLYAKGLLLLGCGILASALLLAEHPSVKTAALLAVAVWSFARAYYFAFYVIEHYIDPGHRYSGARPLRAVAAPAAAATRRSRRAARPTSRGGEYHPIGTRTQGVNTGERHPFLGRPRRGW
jgi:hypothetical protein